jgi:excisionase family DNA binding protein
VARTKEVRGLVRLLSVQEVAGLLQVPVKTIYQWRYLGEGPPALRVGKYTRFDPADVVRWLDGCRAPGTGR